MPWTKPGSSTVLWSAVCMTGAFRFEHFKITKKGQCFGLFSTLKKYKILFNLAECIHYTVKALIILPLYLFFSMKKLLFIWSTDDFFNMNGRVVLNSSNQFSFLKFEVKFLQTDICTINNLKEVGAGLIHSFCD